MVKRKSFLCTLLAAITLAAITPVSAAKKKTTPSTATKTPDAAEQIVAVVNNDIVLRSELDKQLRNVKRQLRARGAKLPPNKVLEKKVLDKLILMRLQLQLAKRTGIRVDDETVNRALVQIAKRNKLSFAQFRRKLAAAGFDFADFRDSIRNQIILARLHRRRVHNRVRVSKQEVDSFLKNKTHMVNKYNSYKLGHILIAIPSNASIDRINKARAKAEKVLKMARDGANFGELAITYSDGQKALKGGVLGWFKSGQLPRAFVSTVVKMQKNQISGIIRSQAGFHIVKLLDIKGTLGEHAIKQTKVQHILIRTNDLVSDTDAKNRLNRLRERLLQGENFDTVAKAHSDDTFSAKKGGHLGWVSKGALVPRFEKIMEETKVSQISKPFKTRYGWHILKVLDRRVEKDTNKYKRSVAKRLIRARKQKETLQLWLQRLRDQSYIEYRIAEYRD